MNSTNMRPGEHLSAISMVKFLMVFTSMTGHVSDSRSLAKYYDVSDELKREALGINEVENYNN